MVQGRSPGCEGDLRTCRAWWEMLGDAEHPFPYGHMFLPRGEAWTPESRLTGLEKVVWEESGNFPSSCKMHHTPQLLEMENAFRICGWHDGCFLCPPCKSVKPLQACLTLWDPMDCNPQGSSAHGILQARILEWAAVLSSRGSSQLRDRTHVSYISCIVRRILYH